MIQRGFTPAAAITVLAIASSAAGDSGWFEAGREAVALALRNEASRNPVARAKNVICGSIAAVSASISSTCRNRISEGCIGGSFTPRHGLRPIASEVTAASNTAATNWYALRIVDGAYPR